MLVIKYRKIFYAISIVIISISFYGVFAYGLNLGIDFKGGAILEMEFTGAPQIESLKEKVAAQSAGWRIGDFSLRPTGEKGIILRTPDLTEAERVSLIQALSEGDAEAKVIQFDSVGPILGEELRAKAMWSIVWVILAIVLFIAFAFRKVSKPISSWKYGIVAVVALLHDVIVPTGVFAFLGYFAGTEIDSLFITALLVVLGFSVHDTIVVFDRTRENLHKNNLAKQSKSFEEIVGESVSQTFARSINTSLTTLISLAVLYAVGPEATRDFALALLIGITAGTYSSIFIGSPLLVTLQKFQDRK